jgi:hypothetical protein
LPFTSVTLTVNWFIFFDDKKYRFTQRRDKSLICQYT